MSVSAGFNPPAGAAVADVLSDVGIHSFLAIATGNQLERLSSSRVAG